MRGQETRGLFNRLRKTKTKAEFPRGGDAFDRLYTHWAEQAASEGLDPPSRERWDAIVLRFVLSEDPARIQRYRRIDATGPDTLGSDVYELWGKLPTYTPNLKVTAEGFEAYDETHRGSMRRLMEEQGLLDRYDALLEGRVARRELTEEEKVRAKGEQRSVMIIGCAGIAFLVMMALTVTLIIFLKLYS